MEATPKELHIYVTAEGREPFTEWLNSLQDQRARAKIRVRLDRVSLGNFGDCHGVGDGVQELRIDYGPALLERIQEEAMKKSRAYQPDLIESLRDSGEAEEYLNAALEENDPELFLLALRNVAEAQGGIAQLAEKAKLNRESLYRMLSDRGNPEFRSLDALLHALGFRLAVTVNR